MRELLTIGILTASTLCLPSVSSADTIINFETDSGTASVVNGSGSNPANGELGGLTLTDQGLTATAFYYKASSHSWTSANTNLWRRNAVGDRGLGVCDPTEGVANCNSGGDYNEISNEDSAELIRLSLPAGFTWVSIQLSSLDNNGQQNVANYERMQLYGDSDTSGSVSSIAGPTVLANAQDNLNLIADVGAGGTEGTVGSDGITVGTGSGCGNAAHGSPAGVVTCAGANTEPTIAIPVADQSLPYLFLDPYDWTGGGNTNNDFLVYTVVLQSTTGIQSVPEPTSMVLLGTGLVGLVVRRRRLRRARSIL